MRVLGGAGVHCKSVIQHVSVLGAGVQPECRTTERKDRGKEGLVQFWAFRKTVHECVTIEGANGTRSV